MVLRMYGVNTAFGLRRTDLDDVFRLILFDGDKCYLMTVDVV